jgi:hypothetical protein
MALKYWKRELIPSLLGSRLAPAVRRTPLLPGGTGARTVLVIERPASLRRASLNTHAMKSMYLKLPGASNFIEVIEHAILDFTMDDDRGKPYYPILIITEKDTVYVHNIYRYLFTLFRISDATRMSCRIATTHLNQIIDDL